MPGRPYSRASCHSASAVPALPFLSSALKQTLLTLLPHSNLWQQWLPLSSQDKLRFTRVREHPSRCPAQKLVVNAWQDERQVLTLSPGPRSPLSPTLFYQCKASVMTWLLADIYPLPSHPPSRPARDRNRSSCVLQQNRGHPKPSGASVAATETSSLGTSVGPAPHASATQQDAEF